MPVPSELKVTATWGLVLIVGLLVSALVPEIFDVVPTFWVSVVGLAFALEGVWERNRLMVLYGAVAVIGGFVSGLALPPAYVPLAFGLFIGVGLAVVSWFTNRWLVPVGAYMLVGSVFSLIAQPEASRLVTFTWFMLGGAAFASIGHLIKNTFTHFLGMGLTFGIVGVSLIGGDFTMMSAVAAVIIAGGMAASFVYMYHTLGRTPKVGEILTLAARALFTYGLRKPLDQYRVIAIAIQGNISTELVTNELLSKLEAKWRPILLLGPTAPTQITVPRGSKLGWVTSLSGIPSPAYTMLSPSNPSDVNIFLADAIKEMAPGSAPVIIGDFLDNMIPLMKEDAFFRYYSDLASRIKLQNHTGVFIVKSDIHPEVAVNVVKRFADVIIENREREERGRLVREVRVSNKVDNLHTQWQRLPPS